jgi:hypothetical protein
MNTSCCEFFLDESFFTGKVVPKSGRQLRVIHSPAYHSVLMLSRLFTSVFATSRVPDTWKTACVTLLYKQDDPTDPFNYRIIAVGVPMVRLSAIVLTRCMLSYLES